MRKAHTRSCILLGAAVALLSAPVLAAVGDLRYARGSPAGRGVPIRFATPQKIEGGRGKTRAMVGSYPLLSVKLLPGETIAVPMGPPIKAIISATVRGRRVSFNVKQTDTAGNPLASVLNAAGRRPKAPAVDVVDKTGKVVYTAQLKYG